jgi:hypothetical protein
MWKKVNLEKSQNWTYIKVIKHQSTWHWHTGSSRRYKPSLLLSPHLYQVCTNDTVVLFILTLRRLDLYCYPGTTWIRTSRHSGTWQSTWSSLLLVRWVIAYVSAFLWFINSILEPSSLAKGYDPLYSSSPLASLDGFSRSHGDGLYVMQLVVAATNQNVLYTSCLRANKDIFSVYNSRYRFALIVCQWFYTPCDLENPSNDAKGEDE